ncbi:ParB/RepB/Spo0J family partition protein [Amycolatopsis sp. NPDC059657]|uniref:ParB/RepB/Spo0J family partition protein n=1 Tax=Amycolatopsis sp. NPDC059657 TaxID=3346899 RepID=UPI00366FE590
MTALHDLGLSPRLRQRRFALLPLRGEGSPFTEAQGRQPGDSTTPIELVDLISSISTVGVLQPVLVEEIRADEHQPPALRLAAGERRLRACRWGAVHRPDNPHFAELPAIVCPGPLSDEERRIWQLVENLAREDLRPGELAAALMLDRCAVLLGKLIAAGRAVPSEVYEIDDPTDRFQAMERIRGTDTTCAAPWAEVLSRLGLQLSPRKARELVRAFAELPRELSEDMDEAKVSLHTRIRFIELRRGREEAANDIWAAVKNTSRMNLLPTALAIATDHDGLSPDEALTAAERVHANANNARAAKLRTGPDEVPVVDRQLVDNALAALRALVAADTPLEEHDRASLRLLADQITGKTVAV